MANPVVQQINAELETLQKELGEFKSTVEYLNGAKNHVKDAVQSVNQAEVHFMQKVGELKKTYESFINLDNEVTNLIIKLDGVNFPERLDSIEKTIKETTNYLNETRTTTLEELKKASEIITKADFDGRFTKLQATIDGSVKSNSELVSFIEKQKLPEKIDGFEKNIGKKLESSILDFQKSTKQIAHETAKSIHDLNLPIRMDKLDTNISGILTAIQNVQSRVESVERNIGEKLNEAAEKHASALSIYQKKILKGLNVLYQEMKTSTKKQKINSYITWGLLVIGFIVIILMLKL